MFQQTSDAFYQTQIAKPISAVSSLEHACLLDIDSEPYTCRNTSIVCTIGK